MTARIPLVEYQDWYDTNHVLTNTDCRFIQQSLQDRIRVYWDPITSAYVLNPGPNVGLASLPSGCRLESVPKINDLRNLFYMLAVANDIPDLYPSDITVDRFEDFLEFVAWHFVGLLEGRLARGLYRAYVEEEANLPKIRGKVLVSEDVRRNGFLGHRKYCRFTELTWDVSENQVLRYVTRMLSGWSFEPGLKRRLDQLDRRMAPITHRFISPSVLARFTYHRLNWDYQPLHRLCKLFLEGSSLSEASGPFPFRAFFVNMNTLFQAFVTAILQKHAPSRTTLASRSLPFDQAQRIDMEPDLVVRYKGRIKMVGDCKYKRTETAQSRNADLYQALAYCTATGLEEALLIYPQHTAESDASVSVRNSGKRISKYTVNLSQDPQTLENECQNLAQAVYAGIGDSRW